MQSGSIRLDAGRYDGQVTLTREQSFRPRAVLLWWAAETDPLTTCANRGGIGVAAHGSQEAASAWAADDATGAGVFRRIGGDSAFLACSDPYGEPDLVGTIVDTVGGCRLGLRGRTPVAWNLHFVAIGGSELCAASVERATLPLAGGVAATSLGFRPDFLLFIPDAGSAPPSTDSLLRASVGFAAGGRQATSAFEARVVDGATLTRSSFRNDAVVALPRSDDSWSYATLARLESLDEEGFTLSCEEAAADGPPVAVLALAGGRYAVDIGAMPRRGRPRRRESIGFAPSGILTVTSGLEAMARVRDLGRLSLGGATRDGALGCVSWSVRRHGLPPEPRARSTSDAVIEVLDTTSGRLYARATRIRFGRRGFALDWSTRDKNPRDFAFAAMGSDSRTSGSYERRGPWSERLRRAALHVRRQ